MKETFLVNKSVIIKNLEKGIDIGYDLANQENSDLKKQIEDLKNEVEKYKNLLFQMQNAAIELSQKIPSKETLEKHKKDNYLIVLDRMGYPRDAIEEWVKKEALLEGKSSHLIGIHQKIDGEIEYNFELRLI